MYRDFLERAVRDVFIDGEQVVCDRNVLTLDREGAFARLQDAQGRMMKKVPERDYARRTAEKMAPLSLPVVT